MDLSIYSTLACLSANSIKLTLSITIAKFNFCLCKVAPVFPHTQIVISLVGMLRDCSHYTQFFTFCFYYKFVFECQDFNHDSFIDRLISFLLNKLTLIAGVTFLGLKRVNLNISLIGVFQHEL